MIDVMGYHVQQAIEKSIKYFLSNIYHESENTRKFKVHNIADLIDYLNEFDQDFIQNYEELMEMAYEITSWEASSRYDEAIYADYSSVMKSIIIANNLY